MKSFGRSRLRHGRPEGTGEDEPVSEGAPEKAPERPLEAQVFRSGPFQGVVRAEVAVPEILACLARFEGPESLEGSHGPEKNGVTVLKRSRATLVAAIPAGNGSDGVRRYCIKRRRYTRRLEAVRSALKPSRAMQAWRNGRRLEAMGLPVARPVGAVERRLRGRLEACYTITEMIPHTCSLVEGAARRARDAGSRGETDGGAAIRRWRAMITHCGAALGELHARGIFLHDLKGENVLIRSSGEGGPWFIDVDRVRFTRQVPRRRRLKNLVQLNASLGRLLTRSDRLRFFGAYDRRSSGAGRRARLSRIHRRTTARRRREAKKKGMVTLDRTGRVGGLEVVNASGLTWRVRKDFLRQGGLTLLESLDRLVSAPGAVTERALSVRTTVRLPWPGGEDGRDGTTRGLVVKRYHVRGWGDRLKYLFFPPKALSEWRMLCALPDLDIPTARPLALGMARRGPFLKDSCLVMEAIPEAVTLGAFVRSRYLGRLGAAAIAEKRSLLRTVARFTARVHEAGVAHRDFHCDNFLLRRPGGGVSDAGPAGIAVTDEGWRLYLIDLHTARIRRRVGRRRLTANLAKLLGSLSVVMTRTDWARFLRVAAAPAGGRKGRRVVAGLSERLFGRLEAGARRYRTGLIRSRLRQPLQGKDLYARHEDGGATLYYRRAHDPDRLLREAGRTQEGDRKGDREARPGPGAPALRVLSFHGGSRRRPEDGRNAWVVGNYLTFYGVPTPEPAALVEGPGGRVDLVTVDPGPATPLSEYVRKGGPKSGAALVEPLAHLLERLSHHRVVLRGFGPETIFVRHMVSDGAEGPRLHLDDLAAVEVDESAPYRKGLVDVGRVRAMFRNVLDRETLDALLTRLAAGPATTGGRP